MSERLPSPVLLVVFEPSATLPDCLRAALNTAKHLRLGIAFDFGPADDLTQYVIQPWMSLEDVLGMWDTVAAQSVKEHIEVHSGGAAHGA